jgi:hypothetical protein
MSGTNEPKNFIWRYQEHSSHGIGETRVPRYHRYESSRCHTRDSTTEYDPKTDQDSHRRLPEQSKSGRTHSSGNISSALMEQDKTSIALMTYDEAYPDACTLAPILLNSQAIISDSSSSRNPDILCRITDTPDYLLPRFPGNLPSSPLNSSLDPFFRLPRHLTSREKSLLHLCTSHTHWRYQYY